MRTLTVAAGDSRRSLLESIMAYRHSGVIHKLKEQGYPEAEAVAIFEDTKRFLFLSGINPAGGYAPTVRIDDGWHHFILHTEDYMAFCQKFFGRYIHHYPNKPGVVAPKGRPRATLTAAIAVFGAEKLSANWHYGTLTPATIGATPSVDEHGFNDPCGDGDSGNCGCSASCNDGDNGDGS